jgi:hypothetical protein
VVADLVGVVVGVAGDNGERANGALVGVRVERLESQRGDLLALVAADELGGGVSGLRHGVSLLESGWAVLPSCIKYGTDHRHPQALE